MPIVRKHTVIAFIAAILPAISAAQDTGKYQCSYADMQRRVEIAHEPGVEVPCSVHYYKDTEMPGEQQVLWSADSDASYCKRMANEFVAKLEGWGWNCGHDSETVTEEDSVEDVEVVEPNEEMLGEPDPPQPPDLQD